MKAYRTNRWMYIGLIVLSISIVAIAFIIPYNDKWFSIISGIGSGSFASVVIAWLIDAANCKIQIKKYDKLAKFAYGELRYAIADQCKQYCDYCCDASPMAKDQSHTFMEWSDMYITLISAGIPQAKKAFVLETILSVQQAYQTFKSNKMIYLDLNLVTEAEYKKMAEVSKRIIMMKGHYMISDIEIKPELIAEANQEIAALLLDIPQFSIIAANKYSQNTETDELSGDEMDVIM